MRVWGRRQKDTIKLGFKKNPYVLVQGVPNSSKTACTVCGFIFWSMQFEHRLFGICAKKYDLLENNVMREVRAFCRDLQLPFRAQAVGMKQAFSIGSNIYVKLSGNNIAQAANVQSYTFTGLYIDEVVNLPEPVFTELENRVRGDPGAKTWMTRNFVSPNHWFKRKYIDQAKTREMLIRDMHFADNPVIDSAFIRRMQLSEGGLYLRRFKGEDAGLYGRIFPSYMKPADPPARAGARSWYLSVDPAQTSRTHALLIGEFDGVYWVVDEFVHDGRDGVATEREQAVALADWVRSQDVTLAGVVTDSESPNFALELHEALGEPIWYARKDVFEGIALTRTVLAAGELRLSRNVPELLTELDSYVFDEQAQLLGIDRPVKRHDHACDALRYFVFTLDKMLRSRPNFTAQPLFANERQMGNVA